jgi:Ca-activated chloride channel family protein
VSPLLIVGLVVAGLVVLVYLFGLTPDPRRRRGPGILRRRSRWRGFLPVLLLLAAIGCLVLAFLGFSISFRETVPVTILVMDVSNSMRATDVAPNRLEAAETAAIAFLEELPDDFLAGLATFARQADLQVAPTEDHAAVIDAVSRFETSGGTRIGDGLTVALDAIEERGRRSDVSAAILLLSDGRDTGSDVPPDRAAARAGELGVPVFTVLIGQVSGKGAADLDAMQDISEASGGETFTAETADQLTERYRALGTQLSLDLAADPSTTPLVIAAIVLGILAGVMLVMNPR